MTRARSDSASATGASARASDAMPCTSSTGGPDPRSTTFRGTPAPSTIGGMATIVPMEGFGGMFGDPDELQRRMAEFAEQMQGQQRLAWADNAIKLAVDLTVAAINRVNIQGTTAEQAEQIRSVMAVVFPEAVTLVREAGEGFPEDGGPQRPAP